MILLSDDYQVTPENLFTLSKRILGIDAEKHWLTENELRLEHTRDDLFRVWFHGNVIGHVTVQPHNPNISRVGVWIDPTQDNPDNKKIIQKLADSIDYNVPKVKTQEPEPQLANVMPDNIQDELIKDDEIELSREAKSLGIRVDTLRKWRDIKPLYDAGMTQVAIAERLIMPPETLKTNIGKMKLKGYIKVNSKTHP